MGCADYQIQPTAAFAELFRKVVVEAASLTFRP
jgi:hypothetical protein